jgi:hypothetical protein
VNEKPDIGDRITDGRSHGRILAINETQVNAKLSWGRVIPIDQLRWDPVGGTWICEP